MRTSTSGRRARNREVSEGQCPVYVGGGKEERLLTCLSGVAKGPGQLPIPLLEKVAGKERGVGDGLQKLKKKNRKP